MRPDRSEQPAVDFFNQINMLYGTITEFCTEISCSVMSAGPRYEYHWADGTNIKKPIKCSAPKYIDYLMTWVQDQLDDETLFPSKIAVGKSTFVRLLKKVEKQWEVIPEPLSKWQNLQTCESREVSERETSTGMRCSTSERAVGKSTFVRLLKKVEKQWEVIPEPLSKWQNLQTCESREGVSGSQQSVSNLLQIMYQDPTRWSYTFQSFSCMSRLRAQLEAPPPSLLELERPLQIFERSVYSDSVSRLSWADCLCLQKCLERLGRRARQEERSVDLQYLERLHSQHEDWLIEKTTPLHFDHLTSTPVLVLDVNEEFEQDQAVQERLVKQL
ncbi:UNVERIFIED_CONTAM: hypothetical protein FKN15_046645 [Acipenser sinensis]